MEVLETLYYIFTIMFYIGTFIVATYGGSKAIEAITEAVNSGKKSLKKAEENIFFSEKIDKIYEYIIKNEEETK